ncbi:hypothetical protein BJ875DRAFT_481011 [Amylocarpus encephaloides]|uniref:Zn(2)-C6 fungal-type domain-containing protein n=1 Tax=Amylocarpus encephaloides TaxID=45428 RepID=A0A9P7YRE5_9HELO|nr:hypothetical protein BJ875DRAFT_481011 [Amylocarpus encephaloides]
MSTALGHLQYPVQPDSSSLPDGSRSSQQPQEAAQPVQHRRVYQACIPCRRRKVKCDLGSVDTPGDPPCVRCRRESKECYFSATRRKRKSEGVESLDGFEQGDDYVVRNGRKMGRSSPGRQTSMGAPPSRSGPTAPWPDNTPVNPGPPLTPGGSVGRPAPLRRPTNQGRDENNRTTSDESGNTQLENLEAREVMSTKVYGPHDALDLLYKAATNSPGHMRGGRHGSSQMSPAMGNREGPMHQPSPHMGTSQPFQQNYMPPPNRDTAIDPMLASYGPNERDGHRDQGYKNALKAWARFRFVRAGWFTPAEAIEYITYYYNFLSPLTPISPPTFQDPSTHETLLTEEPILTVTLLTIATRYRQMPGAGGHCRSHAIHEQLWTYLRGMIERCLWGQEAFGGGFCGSGADASEAQTSSTAPWRGLRKGSLRTLGTIESLMILTEWHPRALHFPPAEATDELMLPSYETPDTYSTDDENGHRLPPGVGGKRIESWLEPAWRSDRMCWMLLSTAMGLAYELGVFDNIEELLAAGGEVTRPEYEDEAYRLRAARIKRLLLIYVSQLAGRLGWTNMVPENLRVTDPVFAPRKRRASNEGKTPDTSTSMSNSFNYIPDLELDDQIIHCWAGISNAMRLGNERLFRSRQYTTKIIQDGSYVDLLKDFQPMLNTWRKEFERFRLPPFIRHILSIEYEYVRIYVNSLSLQAVVERCTNNPIQHSNYQGHTANGTATNNGMSPETQTLYAKLPLGKLGGFSPTDQGYVKEVVDGSRNLLRTVVEGLLPGDYLKHAPVRTYFRIISGAMFLLKTFALGASKQDVEISIGLMDSAVSALRNCVVDDVHLGIRFADLLETLTSRLRSRFISAPRGPQPAMNDDEKRMHSPVMHQGSEAKRMKVNHADHIREWNASTPNFASMSNGELGISATPFDPNSFFNANTSYSQHGQGPYPNSANSNNQDMSDVFGNTGDWGGGSEVWYLPPGAAFFQNVNDSAITQTADGVNVGGMDLLDYMTLDIGASLGDFGG